MAEMVKASRIFSQDQFDRFAELSGDFNPIHVDPTTARRLIFGTAICHGVGLVLWALDELAKTVDRPIRLLSLKAVFRRPVPANQKVDLEFERSNAASAEFVLRSRGSLCANLTVGWEDRPDDSPLSLPRIGDRVGPVDVDRATLEGHSGKIGLYLDPKLLATLAPTAARHFPLGQMALLLATTRLVGMICPGLNSIYNVMDLDFAKGDADVASLAYRVKSYVPRFSRLSIGVESRGVTGELLTSFRPVAQPQASYDRLKTLVAPGQFAGQNALIVGGSRGLGELVAKLVAAGGGNVTVTYKLGKADAETVASELTAQGHNARVRFFDIERQEPGALVDVSGRPFSQVYCFASPRILLDDRDAFDLALFEAYCRYYVSGLDSLIRSVAERGEKPPSVFYPSTAFLDRPVPGSLEYCAAKAAGEAVMRMFAEMGRIRAVIRRLPPLATDQTASLLGTLGAEGADAMLEAVVAMNAA